MPARRFFVEGVQREGARVPIGDSDARKIVRVLRLRDGDRIEVVDSSGALYVARAAIHGDAVAAVLEASIPSAAPPALRVDVAQALPKAAKMDFVVEKCTELGAAAILPFCSERSVARETRPAKLDRWNRLARSAAAQCGRRDVPPVAPPRSFEALLAAFAEYDAVLFPWELAPQVPVRASLPPLLLDARRVLVAIGPEGGFAHAEAEAAGARGAHLIWLGPRILRTETAALVALTLIDAFGATEPGGVASYLSGDHGASV